MRPPVAWTQNTWRIISVVGAGILVWGWDLALTWILGPGRFPSEVFEAIGSGGLLMGWGASRFSDRYERERLQHPGSSEFVRPHPHPRWPERHKPRIRFDNLFQRLLVVLPQSPFRESVSEGRQGKGPPLLSSDLQDR